MSFGGELMMAAATLAFNGRRLHMIDGESGFVTGNTNGTVTRDIPCLYRGSGIFVPQAYAIRTVSTTYSSSFGYPNVAYNVRYSRTNEVFQDALLASLLAVNTTYNIMEGALFAWPNEGYIFQYVNLSATSRNMVVTVLGVEFF